MNDKEYRKLMKEHHERLLSTIHHENKEFEKESIKLFTEYFLEDERIQEEFDKKHPDYVPTALDGGCTHELMVNSKKYFNKYDELKKKYGITDK